MSTRIVLPAGLSGVFASFILAVSRAVGETMAVVLAAGMRPQITLNPLTSIETMTTYIVQIIGGDASYGEPKYLSLFAVGLTLFAVTLSLNIISGLRLAAFSRGLPMNLRSLDRVSSQSLDAAAVSGRFSAWPAWRRPVRGLAVLALLLGSILAAALQGPPENPVVCDRPQCARIVRAGPEPGYSEPRLSGAQSRAGISGRNRRAVCGCWVWWR